MKNIKKLCLYLSLFVITLLFNKNIVRADTTLRIDYHNNNNLEKITTLNEIKEYIDNNNTYNRNYIVGYGPEYNVYYIYVYLISPTNNNNSCNFDKVYMQTTYARDTSTKDRIGNWYIFHYNNTNNCVGAFYKISYSDYINGGSAKNTFYNNINAIIKNGGTGGSGISTAQLNINFIRENISDYSNLAQNNLIYYSSLPMYYIDGRDMTISSNTTTQDINTVCNLNKYTSDKPYILYYNEGISDRLMTCGNEYPTYIEYEEESTPEYFLHEDYNNIDKQIDSLDFYYFNNLNTTIEEYFEFQETMTDTSSNNYNVTGYKFLGKKCNGGTGLYNEGTCWWEEINNNYWSISNDTYTIENNIYTINFKFNFDLTSENYKVVKLAVQHKPSNFGLKIFTREESSKYVSFDINTMRWDYSKEWFYVNNNVSGAYVTNKPNYDNIEYRFYTKRNKEYQLISFFNYNKAKNEITNERIDSLIYKTYKIGDTQYWIETGTINLGTNYPNNLYIFTTFGVNQQEIINPYFNTQVYYVMQQNVLDNIVIDYTGDNNNIQENIKVKVSNDLVREEYENSTSVDFDGLMEIVEEYKQYKEEWLTLFYNIYDYLPQIIKHILILTYFLLHCYGIFLIFKD